MADRRVTQSSEDPQADLLATLAASRELGPEMDKALAESYLAKHGQPAGAASRRQQSGSPAQVTQAAGMIGPAVGIGIYVVLLIASSGHLWWLFWLPMAIGGWWWGMWNPDARGHHRGERREELRQARYEAREQYRAWRRGYPYPSPYPPRSAEYPERAEMTVDPRAQVEAPPATASPNQQPPTSAPTSPLPPANPAG